MINKKIKRLLVIVLLIILAFSLVLSYVVSVLVKRDANQLKAAVELLKDVGGNTRIDYYGKVTDEDGKPLPGAKAVFKIKSLDTSPGALIGSISAGEANYKVDKKILYSDNNGDFKIENESGVFLEISLEKEGYVYASGGKGFLTYSNGYGDYYKPDKGNPVIYRLWKEDKTEPLIIFERVNYRSGRYKTPSEGLLVNLLVNSSVNNMNDADIKIKISSIDKLTDLDEKYNWSCSIEAISGGLIENMEEQFYLAPSDGYHPSVTYNINKDNWIPRIEKKYYFKSRNGNVYGGVKIIFSPVGPGVIIEKAIINPNGSPVLVYNNDKAIRNPDKFYKENFSKNIKNEK